MPGNNKRRKEARFGYKTNFPGVLLCENKIHTSKNLSSMPLPPLLFLLSTRKPNEKTHVNLGPPQPTVDLGALDVPVDVVVFEEFRVGEVFAEPANLPGEAVALGIGPAKVAHGGVDDVLQFFRF